MEFRMEGIAVAVDFPNLAALDPVAGIVAGKVAYKGAGAYHDQGRLHVVGGGGGLELADHAFVALAQIAAPDIVGAAYEFGRYLFAGKAEQAVAAPAVKGMLLAQQRLVVQSGHMVVKGRDPDLQLSLEELALDGVGIVDVEGEVERIVPRHEQRDHLVQPQLRVRHRRIGDADAEVADELAAQLADLDAEEVNRLFELFRRLPYALTVAGELEADAAAVAKPHAQTGFKRGHGGADRGRAYVKLGLRLGKTTTFHDLRKDAQELDVVGVELRYS